MARLYEFKKAILDRYGSESAFARELDWPRQKLNRFTTGARIPDLEDAKQMSDVLRVPIDEMIGFFIPSK